jgi:CheY-like chemotaxis protein
MHPQLTERPARARVLVIDDDRAVTDTLAQVLASDTVAVEVANDPLEGLTQARRHCPSLIIVDLQMPGMDGYAFIEACRATPECAEVPIFLATGSGDAAAVRCRIDGKGIVLLLPKPFDLDTLTAAVQGAIRSPTPSRR